MAKAEPGTSSGSQPGHTLSRCAEVPGCSRNTRRLAWLVAQTPMSQTWVNPQARHCTRSSSGTSPSPTGRFNRADHSRSQLRACTSYRSGRDTVGTMNRGSAQCAAPSAQCSALIADCSLLIAHCSLLIAHCSLLIAHCSLLIGAAELSTFNVQLPTITSNVNFQRRGTLNQQPRTLNPEPGTLNPEPGSSAIEYLHGFAGIIDAQDQQAFARFGWRGAIAVIDVNLG